MGWNDHLPDPDAWEDYVGVMLDRADHARKAEKESPQPTGDDD